MNTLGHYLRIWRVSAALAVQRSIAFRRDFLMEGVQAFLWGGFYVVAANVYFANTSQIGGWQYHELLTILGTYQVVQGLNAALLQPNLPLISEYVRKGTLDLLLVKPVNALFYVSTRNIAVWRLLNAVAGLVVIAYGLHLADRPVTLAHVVTFALMTIVSFLLSYSLMLILMTLAFTFVRVDNLLSILQAFWEAGRYPTSAYQGALRLIVTYLVPVVFVVSLPASAVTGRLSPGLFAQALAVAAVFLASAIALWHRAIRRYTSVGG